MGPACCLWNGAASSAEWRHRANGQLHTTGEVEEAPSRTLWPSILSPISSSLLERPMGTLML
jgi:hypothetical protein